MKRLYSIRRASTHYYTLVLPTKKVNLTNKIGKTVVLATVLPTLKCKTITQSEKTDA